jgi:mono/diheme cytochrome c family protein
MRLRHLFVVIAVVLAAASVYGWTIISGGFSARSTPSRVEGFVAKRLRSLATPMRVRDATNPVPRSPEVLSAAKAHFADHCASCHGNDGRGATLIGRGLYPKPPDMTQSETQNLTDGELYYIIENGIRFTGMPAFGEVEGDETNEESWALVHFIRYLPTMADDEAVEMKKMNPKSPGELAKEEEMRKFLAGEDVVPVEGSHEHHH